MRPGGAARSARGPGRSSRAVAGPSRRRRRLRASVLVAAGLAAAACGGRSGADDAGPPDGEAAAPVAAWTDSAPEVALDSVLRRVEAAVGGSRNAARERMGTPREVRRRTVPNRHVEGAVDTLVRLSWRGATARFHKSGANQREFLSSVEVTGRSLLERLLPPVLRTREGLRGLLDVPDRVRGRSWVYRCCPGRAATETLAFRLDGQRVTGVRAGFFVD